jgi:hypothetical protein
MTTETSAAMQPSFLSELNNAQIRADVADALGGGDTLTYQGMLHILDDAAVGGMTASKFSTLETLASLLNAPGGIATSEYVQDISRSLIDGDPANTFWTGGKPKPTELRDLSATSSEQQVDQLIDKWFLGTDHPSTTHVGAGPVVPTWEVQHGPLFAANEPSYLDVNQGVAGDCWFLSTLADVALQDPAAIKSMITDNGNGTYGVRFFVDGLATYVTVDNQLPFVTKNWENGNGSTLEFANGAKGQPIWAELVEKAFAELNAEPDAIHGHTTNTASNAYSGIVDGYASYALEEITGQNSVSYYSSNLVTNVKTIGEAFESGEELEVSFGTLPKGYQGNLVGDHVMEIIGYNSGSESFEIHNPWGSANETAKSMTFTMSVQDLAAAGASITVAQGSALGQPASA